MIAFTQAVADWHDFYLLVGTAAAMLVGLLFVALTLRMDKLRGDPHNDTRILAYRTFYTFIYVLMISGALLIPHQTPLGVGLPLLLISGLGLFNTARNIAYVRRGQSGLRRPEASHDVMRRFLTVAVSLVGLVVVALWAMTGSVTAFYWLTGVILGLLVFASENAWDMLMEMRETRD